jgi:hypothetical protein
MIVMRVPLLRAVPLLACLLAGCSALILEEVGEIKVPRDCTDITKLFNTFSMRAKSISWKGSKSDAAAALTIELVFENDKKWPIALSNSGNGVLYAVEFSLHGEDGAGHGPKEATGVTLSSERKKPKEAPTVGLFSQQRQTKKSTAKIEKIPDVNFRIRPGEPEQGKLVFEVPRNNYLLTIERKFGAKPVPGMPTDHVSVCRISAKEFSAMKPSSPRGVSGVY